MTNSMPTAAELLGSRRRVLVTGGAGFIGGAVVRRLLKESEALLALLRESDDSVGGPFTARYSPLRSPARRPL